MMFERITEDYLQPWRAPDEPSVIHQTPVYVFPTMHQGKLLTLPDSQLIQGKRNSVSSHERNAIDITKNILPVKWLGTLDLPKNSPINGYGYVVEPVLEMQKKNNFADFTTNQVSSDHEYPFELHHPQAILDRLEDTPEHNAEIEFLHAYEKYIKFILRRTVHTA